MLHFFFSASLLCDRLRQEVEEREAELKKERDQVLTLSKVEANLPASLQAEVQKSNILDATILEVRAQLQASQNINQELEVAKQVLTLKLAAKEDELQVLMRSSQSELQTARDSCAEAMRELTSSRSDLERERSRCFELEKGLGQSSQE